MVRSEVYNVWCVVVAVLMYYFSVAGALWWAVLTISWYLAAARKVERTCSVCTLYVHVCMGQSTYYIMCYYVIVMEECQVYLSRSKVKVKCPVASLGEVSGAGGQVTPEGKNCGQIYKE